MSRHRLKSSKHKLFPTLTPTQGTCPREQMPLSTFHCLLVLAVEYERNEMKILILKSYPIRAEIAIYINLYFPICKTAGEHTVTWSGPARCKSSAGSSHWAPSRRRGDRDPPAGHVVPTPAPPSVLLFSFVKMVECVLCQQVRTIQKAARRARSDLSSTSWFSLVRGWQPCFERTSPELFVTPRQNAVCSYPGIEAAS